MIHSTALSLAHPRPSAGDASNPGHPSGRICRNKLTATPALLLFAAGLGIASLYLARPGYGIELFYAYLTQPMLLLLNLLPVVVAVFFLYALTNRAWIAALGSSLLVMIPTIANYLKIAFRGDPLMASDVLLLSEALKIGTNYSLTLPLLLPLVLICLLLAAGIVLLFFLPKYKWHPLLRAGTALVLAIAATLLVSLVYPNDTLYAETENTSIVFADGSELSPWSDTDRYLCHGFLYPFLHSISEIGEDVPDNYNAETAAQLLQSYASSDIPDDQKVSVISIMLEAYNDFSKFDNITFVADPYIFLHDLQQESWSGTLVTNIFAGGTIDTERAFITGNTKEYDYRKSAGSFAHYFREQGYVTTFAHPGYDWFYNRFNVSEYFGFEQSYFFENRYTTDSGYMIGDTAFFADLITLYEEATADGSPYFNFSVTYQNHGPYVDNELLTSSSEYVSHAGLSDEAYYIFNNYLSGIASTNAAMENLVNYFRGVEEPVVLVFFGDHNPGLGNNAFVYDELGIDLDVGTRRGFYNYASTPWVIWANDAAKAAVGNAFTGDGGSISPCFLMQELFTLCGWEGDAFMRANMELHKTFDVVSTLGYYRTTEDGALLPSMTKKEAALLNQYRQMEYYRKQDLY